MAYTNSDHNNTHFLDLQIYSDFCLASCILTQRNQKKLIWKKSIKYAFQVKKKFANLQYLTTIKRAHDDESHSGD